MRECTVEDLQTEENSHRGAPNKDFRLDRKKKTLLSFPTSKTAGTQIHSGRLKALLWVLNNTVNSSLLLDAQQ